MDAMKKVEREVDQREMTEKQTKEGTTEEGKKEEGRKIISKMVKKVVQHTVLLKENANKSGYLTVKLT